MQIELFEVEGKILRPTKHCFSIKWLKDIMDAFPDDYLKMYQYIYYMNMPGKVNPYSNLDETIKEYNILKDIEATFSTEEDLLIEAMVKAKPMYTTVIVRAHDNLKQMLDNVGEYIGTATVTAGRDGNINSLIKVGKDFEDLRKSYKSSVSDMEDELEEGRAKGGTDLAYDQ